MLLLHFSIEKLPSTNFLYFLTEYFPVMKACGWVPRQYDENGDDDDDRHNHHHYQQTIPLRSLV
jgi:hypothetical protein